MGKKRFSQRVKDTQPPPLVKLGRLASETPGCISLGQGVPFYGPPKNIIEEFEQQLKLLETHKYSPDPGIPELRHKLANKLKKENNISADPEEIILTPGANIGFHVALNTITDPGDKIILMSPYYFNHVMAATLLNVEPIDIPMTQNFQIPIEQIQKTLDLDKKGRIRAIVLVSPGNPTGHVYEKSNLKQLVEIVENKELWIISDETYEYFTYSGKKHVSIASFKSISDKTITISSFSKTYGIPGWRLGYFHAPLDFIEQAIKVQDTTAICAPKPSQLLALKLLENKDKIIRNNISKMEKNYTLSRELVSEVPWLSETSSYGAFYLFPKQTTGKSSMKIVEKIIKEAKVYMVPGEPFGKAGKHHLRISFGNTSQEQLIEAFDRLKKYKP